MHQSLCPINETGNLRNAIPSYREPDMAHTAGIFIEDAKATLHFFIVLMLRTVNGAGSAFSSGTVEKREVLGLFRGHQ